MERKTPPDSDRRNPEDERKDRFARAMSKSEFGRFYWNKERSAEVAESARRHARRQKKR